MQSMALDKILFVQGLPGCCRFGVVQCKNGASWLWPCSTDVGSEEPNRRPYVAEVLLNPQLEKYTISSRTPAYVWWLRRQKFQHSCVNQWFTYQLYTCYVSLVRSVAPIKFLAHWPVTTAPKFQHNGYAEFIQPRLYKPLQRNIWICFPVGAEPHWQCNHNSKPDFEICDSSDGRTVVQICLHLVDWCRFLACLVHTGADFATGWCASSSHMPHFAVWPGLFKLFLGWFIFQLI